jgi:hypothetical protein
MNVKDVKTIGVSKHHTSKDTTYVIYDKDTGKPVCRLVDKPVYDKFDLDKSFLSGMGSAFNIPGNYYSFDRYLNGNDDTAAIASDWNKVGAALWNAMYSY